MPFEMMRSPVALMLLAAITGCASSMAMVRSTYKDTSILEIGADRASVIKQLGQPDASANLKQGGHIDIYRIDPNAHTDVSRRAAGASHIILSAFTFGLWEFVGVPLELAARDKPLTFVIQYDASGKLFQMEAVEEWKPQALTEADRKKCHQYASLKAMEVAVPQEAQPLDAVKANIAANGQREKVYQRVMHQCLLRTYADSGG